ncbi:hypothetical protein [Gluconacetobacter sp.]|uniref:DUF6874 family protein n=1 Tax=Gluconacetobacter sp. TaxID=1935994 RepID=UPI0039E81E3D
MVRFDISDEDADLVSRIADRLVDALVSQGIKKASWTVFHLETRMDLTAAHANGCPMDFDLLLNTDKTTLMHDVGGISRHLDRDTGTLTGNFRPRTARKEASL